SRDWSSDVCSSDLAGHRDDVGGEAEAVFHDLRHILRVLLVAPGAGEGEQVGDHRGGLLALFGGVPEDAVELGNGVAIGGGTVAVDQLPGGAHIVDQRRQGGVDVVGHGGGQFPQGRHLVPLDQHVLGEHPLGDV